MKWPGQWFVIAVTIQVKRTSLEGRMTTAAEIAASVVFLPSPTQSGHTTAQHIIVDAATFTFPALRSTFF